MKKHEAMTVGQIIEQAINNTGHRDSYDRQQICYLWAEVVGPSINRLTIRRFIDNDVLHVYLASAPLKNELSFQSTALISKLNSLVGKNVISKIIFH